MFENKIETLKKMGYEVLDNADGKYIHVFLKTKSGIVYHFTPSYFDLQKNDFIERIVREFNQTIV